ncbi:hypothetical protein AAG570_012316 [Ranatra chinensis]|uniref:Uncharacterized protein n=1 Tax=Ranatra chinensis TaxID=642074 RepID=A0ABD0YIT8_9HEMI
MNDTVFVENKQFFIALAQRLHKTKPETCERYVWWKVLSAVVPHSSSEIRQLRDDFYEALLKRPPQPRPVRCVKYVKSFLNMAISYKFAMDDNMEATSERVREMLNDITDAFNRLVDSLSWMDDKTKSSIRDKASNIGSYIGYPNWLLQPGQLDEYYKHVEVIDGQFLRSMIRIKSTEVGKVLASIGTKPENATRDVWMSDPLEVNAFYSRSSNAVAIPAGILQSPFYYLGIEALNYGAIGTILGHELTHAFDVEGKDYDKKGRRNSWWTDDMTKEYNSRADCFVKQYQQYKIVGKYQLNGTLTLAENIADNGGVREALHAYRAHLSKRSRPEPKLPPFTNFTNEQLFFLAFANVWCETTSEESALGSLSDVHSPNRFRVIGTLANLQEFAEAWQCPPGSNMNPQDKCVLW